MIIKFLKNFAYGFTTLNLLVLIFYNISLTNTSNLLIFVTFLTVVEMFLIPPVSLLLFPFNFLVFGQIKNLLHIISFIILIKIIPFATFDNFFFNQTSIMGIMIPQVSFDKIVFLILFAILYQVIKALVFVDTKEKK